MTIAEAILRVSAYFSAICSLSFGALAITTDELAWVLPSAFSCVFFALLMLEVMDLAERNPQNDNQTLA